MHSHGQEGKVNHPRFPEFKPISIEDQEFIKKFIDRYPSDACEVIFGNLFIWRNSEHTRFTTVNDNLCILCEPLSEPAYFLQPIGENRMKETISICLDFAQRLSRIPEEFASEYCSEYRRDLDRDNFDYVYLSKNLLELKGKRYDGKRNRMRKFEKSHSYRYLRLSEEHLDDCRALLEEWLIAKASTDGLLSAQRDAILESLRYFEALRLVGGAVEVEGRIAAFSIGEKLKEDTAVVHIEIVSPKYEGLSQVMNREFINNEWSAYRFINREQDLGIAGLRRAKTSYNPHHMVRKYNIFKK